MSQATPCTTVCNTNTTALLSPAELEAIQLRMDGLSIEKIMASTGLPERKIKFLIKDLPKPTKRAKGAGRKPTITSNPIHHIFHELTPKDHRPGWFDDILFGSCLTAAKQSGNVSNVSIEAVLGALHMKEFSVGQLLASGMDKRKAQLVLQAARHAANGILHHLQRRDPELMERLEATAKVEAEYAYDWPTQVRSRKTRPLTPTPTPAHIMELYYQGDYLAYGRALRIFRLIDTELEEPALLAA